MGLDRGRKHMASEDGSLRVRIGSFMYPGSDLTSPLKNKTGKELVTTLEEIRGGPI